MPALNNSGCRKLPAVPTRTGASYRSLHGLTIRDLNCAMICATTLSHTGWRSQQSKAHGERTHPGTLCASLSPRTAPFHSLTRHHPRVNATTYLHQPATMRCARPVRPPHHSSLRPRAHSQNPPRACAPANPDRTPPHPCHLIVQRTVHTRACDRPAQSARCATQSACTLFHTHIHSHTPA